MYWTQAQAAWARDMNVLVRTDGDPTRLASPVRQAVARHDPELALTRTGTLEDRIADSVASPRFRTVLLAAFSVLALLLAVLGTYGVMAFVVAQRRHEIGVRMALGADERRVLGDVLRDGLRLAGIATVFGLAGAAVASRLLAGLLFDVQPLDVPIHTGAVLLLVASALFACWLPARRAASVDPVETLRQ
jgi:putative ABC transport system permease protein